MSRVLWQVRRMLHGQNMRLIPMLIVFATNIELLHIVRAPFLLCTLASLLMPVDKIETL